MLRKAALILGALVPGFTGSSKPAFADAVTLVDKPAPLFELSNQDKQVFKLADRKGKGWTVLFFYPKAGTPGCTKQACAFRDAVKDIRKKNAEVYGISADSTEAQKKFHDEHKMTFDLLADPDGDVIRKYDVKMPVITIAKRITFIIDPDLVVRKVFPDVDPSLDAKMVGDALTALQAKNRQGS